MPRHVAMAVLSYNCYNSIFPPHTVIALFFHEARLHVRFLSAIFVTLFSAIFVALELAVKIASVNKQRFLCDLSPRYRRGFAGTCSKLDATWRRFGGNRCSKYRTEISAKSLRVYTCDKSCIGERDKNCTKNRMCKRAYRHVG